MAAEAAKFTGLNTLLSREKAIVSQKKAMYNTGTFSAYLLVTSPSFPSSD